MNTTSVLCYALKIVTSRNDHVTFYHNLYHKFTKEKHLKDTKDQGPGVIWEHHQTTIQV